MARVLMVAGAVVGLLLLPVAWIVFVVTPAVRGDLVTLLARHYGQDVTMGALSWRFVPAPAISGERITIRREAADSGPPLIEIDRFQIDASWRGLLSAPRRVREVRVAGLRLTVPPRSGGGDPAHDAGRVEPPAPAPRTPGTISPPPPSATPGSSGPLLIERVVATDVRVELGSARADKPPRVFELPELTLGAIGNDTPVAFEAVVINPTPPARVTTTGSLGPWNRETPSRTALNGRYEMIDGRLDVFRGVAGTLAATGTFAGELDDLRITGDATIPDFALDVGLPVDMRTSYQALVGNRGDVELETVTARFGATTLEVAGRVVRSPNEAGRLIDLSVKETAARIEDVLRLALRVETPPMTGPLRLRSRVLIPAGPGRVIDRLRVAGEFTIARAVFTSTNIQSTLERVSRFGQQRAATAPVDGESTVSDLSGVFELRSGAMTFQPVRFAVPGFAVELAGTYTLGSEELDLAGRVRVARTASQMVTGRSSRWLDLADRLLAPPEANGGTELPLTIRGPRRRPSVRVDPSVLTRGLQRNLRRNLDDLLRSGAWPPAPPP